MMCMYMTTRWEFMMELQWASPVSQNIPGGTAWINFVSGGKLVASVQPNNQNLGNTNVQAYIKTRRSTQ